MAPSGIWYGGAVYDYDSASRLATVTGGYTTFSYGYLASSPLIGNIGFETDSGSTRLTVTRDYDYLNRLTSITSAPSGDEPLSFGYGYNDANEWVQVRLADGVPRGLPNIYGSRAWCVSVYSWYSVV